MIIRHDPPREIRPYDRSVKAWLEHVCWRKLAYPKKAQAEEAAQKGMEARPHLRLRVYQCPWCSNWHLTKKPERKR